VNRDAGEGLQDMVNLGTHQELEKGGLELASDMRQVPEGGASDSDRPATLLVNIVSAVTFGLGLVPACLLPVTGIVAVVLFIYYAVLAYQGEYFDVPVVTAFCRNQGWLWTQGF
jgi:hypothetical protein